ncbi:hypothetical protein [Methylomonas koyamae]|nr:hypothetical protein [Methylomonas koyamae]
MAYNQAISAPQADCAAGNAGDADREGAYLLGFTGKTRLCRQADL